MSGNDLTLEEKLARFVERYKNYQGMEIADTQGFIRSLCKCYGPWDYEPGTVFEQHPVEQDDLQSAMFDDMPRRKVNAGRSTSQRMDFYLRNVVIWEQKGPGEDLSRHFQQLLNYWAWRPTKYLVLCNFKEFRIWNTDEEDWRTKPPYTFPLAELPSRAEAFNFLRGGEFYFAKESARVTRKAAQHVGAFLRELIRDSAQPQIDRPQFTKFTLECVFAMFAEDAKIFKTPVFTDAMKASVNIGNLKPVWELFHDLGREDDNVRSSLVPYVNGPLFDREHIEFPVAKQLLSILEHAARDFDWKHVRPEIFGSIFERSLMVDERHSAGAHFTAEADIMKVVGPTIIRPWRERIDACTSHKQVATLIERMKNFHILDPACGSGNFLYIAYREMKALEADLKARYVHHYRHKVAKRASDVASPPPGPYFSIKQLHGIDKLEEAVQLTRVVLWIGDYLANQELSLGERSLPLTSLENNIIREDALFVEWFPRKDDDMRELAIIGNPPFMGAKKMRSEMGDETVDQLHKAFPQHREADLVTYWYPKAIQTLRKGERGGFVSPKQLSKGNNRKASLDLLINAGATIYDAYRAFDWPGEANLDVVIVNWILGPYDGSHYLDGEQVLHISPNLESRSHGDKSSFSAPHKINPVISFMGMTVGTIEFTLSKEEADYVTSKDPLSAEVIKPFLTGLDFNRSPEQAASRMIVDFAQMNHEQAIKYKAAFEFVRARVYPIKMQSRQSASEKAKWWQFKGPAGDLRNAIADLDKYIAIAVNTPHVMFSLVDGAIVPDKKLIVFPFQDYYHLGVLQAVPHEVWAWEFGGSLEERLAYTHSQIASTFPFPLLPDGSYDPRAVPKSPAAKQVARVAEKLYSKRKAACWKLELGLTKLYNLIKGKLDSRGNNPYEGLTPAQRKLIDELRLLHDQLNVAICACYGWPLDTWRDENEVLTRLLALNKQLAGA